MAMPNGYSDETLRLAARLYYMDGLGQAEVAQFVRVSQAKVSRLLAMARARGIVRISVAEYEPRDPALERQLQKQFKFSAVAVIKTAAGAAAADARRSVARFGSAFVASLIPPNSIVAIAGGRTMRELVQHLPEDRERHVTAVQAMGSVDSNVGPVDAFELGRSMARRLGGSFMTINTPAFVPDRKTRDSFLALPQIRAVWQRLNEADVALIGIGTLDNSVFVERGVLSAGDLKKLAACGAVGEICGRFFDRNGRECDSPWRDRVISIELEHLRRTPQVIGMITGADRADAIRAAVKGGLIKSLIIDVPGAQALLDSKPSGAAAKPKTKSKK
jgi:DNA-binding transcriptional regulator LsrR (DeoR family)